MATVPLSGTNIRLLSGVPFNNDYKHTRWFESLSEQTTWFQSRNVIHSMSQANFQRIEGKHFIAVNKSIDDLWSTNFLMFQNAQYNNKWFYAFVTKLEYVQKNTTYVHFQIDVLQTWMFEMNFKPSFVIREHCPLWNEDGSPVINTTDEGLDYGSEYETVEITNYRPVSGVYFLVIVSKNAMHYAGGTKYDKVTPTLNGLPQPLSYYIHPFKLDGTSPNVTIGGTSYSINTILEVLENIYLQTDAVNNVVSMYVTDYIGYNVNYNTTSDTIALDDTSFGRASVSDNEAQTINTIYLKSVPEYVDESKSFGNKYDGYNSVTESKLLMYPYTVLILDDFKGNRTVLKNEYIKTQTLNVTCRGSIGTSNKVAYHVQDYLQDSTMTNAMIGELEHALVNNTPNDVPILSDYLSAYMQGHKNSLENQKNSILWNGKMDAIGGLASGGASALRGNELGAFGASVNVLQGAGNTVLQLQGIEAKLKDIGNIPPNLVKMGSNSAYDYGNNIQGVYIVKKQITSEYRGKLTAFFHMYGYKVNRVKVPYFHNRTLWNFVQTASCVITGNFNNEDLQELKNIFDNGITLWHTDDIGNYLLTNEVI